MLFSSSVQSGGVASQALSFALSRIMDGGVISCLVACQCGKWDVPKVNGGVDGSDILQSTLTSSFAKERVENCI